MTTDQKGSIAEAAIMLAAIKLGIGVLKPVNDGLRYDLVFDLASRLWRVQCKWAVRCGDVVQVRCYSCRRGPEGLRRTVYSPDEVDAFAAYCMDLDRCWFLPIEHFPRRRAIQLRLSPTRNNQALGINWADDFDFPAKLRASGP
jgi:hypothetical protein